MVPAMTQTDIPAMAPVLPNHRDQELDPDSAAALAATLRPDRAAMIEAYFRHVPAEDQPKTAQDVLGIVDGHWRVGQRRNPGEVRIRVFNPAPSAAEGTVGWTDTKTVIDIVTDDMPSLVDSVIGALTMQNVTVHRVLHPILLGCRDANGELLTVAEDSGRAPEHGFNFRESWMHILIDRLSDAERAETIEDALRHALDNVRSVVGDSGALTGAAASVAAELRGTFSPRSAQEVSEAADFLYWLISGNMTFLGYCRHEILAGSAGSTLAPVPGSGLGILRESVTGSTEDGSDQLMTITGAHPAHLLLTQASAGSALTRDVPPFEVRARILSSDGSVLTEHRFLGVLTPRALNAEITTTPVLRLIVQSVLSTLGAAPDTYTGQRAMDLLATFPRAELFWADPHQVVEVVSSVLQLASRRRLRAFLQPDPFGRFVSVMVYLPRDRYTTDCRLAMQHILLDAFNGSGIRYTARVGDSLLAAVHFTVSTDPANPVAPDLNALTKALRSTIRTWDDRLVAAVVGGGDEDLDTAGALSRYADAFDEGYKETYQVDDAVADLRLLDQLKGPDDLALKMTRGDADTVGDWRLKLYVSGGAVTLSRALPVLQTLGADVLDERPFEVRQSAGTLSRIYDFGLSFPTEDVSKGADDPELRTRFSEAFIAAWSGHSEVDGFNQLVLAAGLNWREVATLRSYAHYLRQIGTPYTQRYVEQVLCSHPLLAADLARLFAVQFDPDLFADSVDGRSDRAKEAARLVSSMTAALDAVTSLDADRILRTLLSVITATSRTNEYRVDDLGNRREYQSVKLDPHKVPGVPKPVPAHEIWVYSPRLEGVHLRFGDVARGGLRWSDRPEDFRTEILGLVKAQEVKNAVIVPVGAKGGFVVKRPPTPIGDPQVDRERQLAEGVACYRMFIAGLLDLTDNRHGGAIVPPDRVVRRDDDDSYLVVAADKGTATFSDIANGVAQDYGFWLDDAFASGGSVGYDHKAMGITARGAWESVKHHFRELGIDTQAEDFSCVGVGDMSGDVFGNGMLLSQHIRLLAAFDHRHIFIDPNPDVGESFVERLRLFELPRSSWADYDPALISAGGGVFPRTAKSIPITEQMRDALGLDPEIDAMSPTELMHAILLAPADLLWNGGIGTYIKASTEVNAAVGDKANDALRVDGAELRVKVVGEGGNLGVTQLGRIEFARSGGRINTDAIDNSAGVDTSDHEVNIKIALQNRMEAGDLDEAGRRELLTSMTDEVAELVLADNRGQNRVLGASRLHASSMLTVHSRLIDAMVESGQLDRNLEFLPNHQQINARLGAGEGLAGPELAVLLAYVKAGLSRAMLAGELPDDPAYAATLPAYFPSQMRDGSPAAAKSITEHPLAREIVTTETVNELVNRAGISYSFRLEEEMAATPEDAIRAYTITSAVFDLPAVWAAVAALNNRAPAKTQDTLILRTRRLLDRAARWLLTRRPQPLEVVGEIDRYRQPVADLTPMLPRLVCGEDRASVDRAIEELVGAGTPVALASTVAYSLHTFSLLDAVDVAADTGRDLLECAELLYALSAHLDFDRLLSAVTALDRGDRWHALARQALRDDLYRSLRMLTADVLSTTSGAQDAFSKINQWEAENASRLARARRTLGEIATVSGGDLAPLSVAAREIRSMIR
jgi:glutamate dehydrogenase